VDRAAGACREANIETQSGHRRKAVVARNKFKAQNTKGSAILRTSEWHLNSFSFERLVLVSDFGFRASNFAALDAL
jgi:hypothetical protein